VKAQKLELVRQNFIVQGSCSSSWMTFVLLLPDRHAESCQRRFAAADRVRGYLGETGTRVLTRMMGLLLTAFAVQFMLNGLTDIGLVKSSR
jgi:small neutral amino acid transporter SnatA (MarC family)